MAALTENQPDRNAEILQELTDFWGDEKTAEQALSLLQENGLVDENGTPQTDWSDSLILRDSSGERSVTTEELQQMIDEGTVAADAVISVDGTDVPLEDFSTMLQIRREVQRIRDTYLQEEVELTPEQGESLLSLYEQLQQDGIVLYNTYGAQGLDFASGVNQNARISMSLSAGTVDAVSGGTVTVTFRAVNANPGQQISFDAAVFAGSAVGFVEESTQHITLDENGEASMQVQVKAADMTWNNPDLWSGSLLFYIQLSNPQGALFSGDSTSLIQPVKITSSKSFPEVAATYQVKSGSQTFTLDEYTQYLLRNGILNAYSWTTSNNLPSNVVYSISGPGTGSDKPVVSCLQYLNLSAKMGDQNLVAFEAGYTDSAESKGLNYHNSTAANEAFIRNAASGNFSSAEFKLNRVGSANTSVKPAGSTGTALPGSLQNATSITLQASGRWEKIRGYGVVSSMPFYYAEVSESQNATVDLSLSLKDTQAPTVQSVSCPEGTFTPGMRVPITVTFSEPVKAASGIRLTVNGTSLPVQESSYSGKTLSFLYTVPTVDAANLTVSSISGVSDLSGNAVQSLNSTVFEDRLSTPVLRDAVDSAPAAVAGDPVYTPPSGDEPAKTTATVQVTLKLPEQEELRNLVLASRTLEDGRLASAVLVGSVDGQTALPLVFDDSSAPQTMTVTLELDAAELLERQNYVMEFYTLDSQNPDAPLTADRLLFGKYAAFSVKEPVPLTADKIQVTAPQGWPTQPVYVNDSPSPDALRWTASVEGEGYTWPQISWYSDNPAAADITADGQVSLFGPGTANFYVKAVNGGLYEGDAYVKQVGSITVQEGAEPYLTIPETSLSVRAGEPLTLRWASNLVQKNAEYGQNASTTFTICVYKGTEAQGEPLQTHTVTYTPATPDAEDQQGLWVNGSPNQFLILQGLDSTDPSGYTLTVQAEANSQVPGISEFTFTASTHLTVVSQPVKVQLQRPDNLFQTNGNGPLTIAYTLENYDAAGAGAEFRLVVTDNASGKTVTTLDQPDSAAGGSFTLDLSQTEISDGLRTIYDISLQAKNTAEPDWSRDSFTLYVYDRNALDILVQPVTRDGVETVRVDGDTVTMSNEEWIASLTQDQILALNRDIDLQTAISINYGAHAWGEVSDRIRWSAEQNATASVNYSQGSYYTDISKLAYDSYAPATEFLLAGKNDGTTVVKAIHALAGDSLSSSVSVNVETLRNKLYLFQFYPAVAGLSISYTNGNGETCTVEGDGQGRFAVYEESGIASDVYVKGEVDGEIYLGTVYRSKLVSQEQDAASLELYPVNTLTLRKVATLPLSLNNSDGTPFNGTATVRAGVYRNGSLCKDALYTTEAGASADLSGFEDQTVTFTNGAATFYFDPTQFHTEQTSAPITAEDDIQFVLELRVDGETTYYPLLFTASGTSNETDAIRLAQRIATLETVPAGLEEQPFVARQVVYFSADETGPTTDVRNKKGKVGPSADYPDLLLCTAVLWWGKENTEGEGLSLRYTDANGCVLENQTVDNAAYPFCSMPVSYSTVPLNQSQLDTLSMPDMSIRPIALSYLDADGRTIKQESMTWQLLNALNMPKAGESQSLLDSINSLRSTIANCGSDGLTLSNDFLAVGLNAATSVGVSTDFLTLQLTPTEDPTVFRGLVYVGLATDGEEVSGAGGYEGNLLTTMQPEDEGSYELEYTPGLSDIKEMAASGLTAYGQTQKDMLTSARNLLKSNIRQGGLSSVAQSESGMELSMSGYFETEVYFDFEEQIWKMQLVTGGFQAGGGYGYNWSSNFQVGPVPMFLELGAGVAGTVDFNAAVNHEENLNDYLTQLEINAYLNAFGGFGFDYAVVALKMGIFGEVSLTATMRWLNAAKAASAQFAHSVDLGGEIGIKAEATVLFISYSAVLWSEPFDTTLGQSDNWDSVEEYWQTVGAGKSGAGSIISPEGASLLAVDPLTGMALYTAQQPATLVDRDYLSQYARNYQTAGPDGVSLLSSANGAPDSTVSTLVENAYSYASPVLSDDGSWMFYLDDGANAADATCVHVAAAQRNSSNGYDVNALNAVSTEGYGDSGLNAAGSESAPVVVWSRLMEKPAVTEPGQAVTPDVQAAMMNSSDVLVAVRSGNDWQVTNLTEGNGQADLAPVVAANGQNILVAWRQVASSDAQDLTNFDTRDYILYRQSNDGGATWSDAQPLYNGTSGAVKGLEAAMLPDGTASVAFTLQTGEGDSSTGTYRQEIAYAVIDTNAAVTRYVQMTDDANLDENPQLAAVEWNGENVFVIGWHCVTETGANDIRLAAINAQGNRMPGFVDSLSDLVRNAGVSIDAEFRFVQNTASLDDLSILWVETEAAGTDSEDSLTGYFLSGLRFCNDEGKVSVTAAQRLLEMEDSTSLDQFSAYTQNGKIYAVMQGTFYDYNNPETYTVADRTIYVAGDKTNLYAARTSYTDTLRVDSVLPDYQNLHADMTVPVQFGVTNLGTSPIEQLTLTLGEESTTFTAGENNFAALVPGETRSLTVSVTAATKDGQIQNPDYTLSAVFANQAVYTTEQNTLTLNIPDLGIAQTDALAGARDGQRVLQFTLYNGSDALVSGSGRNVQFGIFQDAECTQPVSAEYFTEIGTLSADGTALKTLDEQELAAVDSGVCTLQYSFDLKRYIQDHPDFAEEGEVRADGITLYAKAWVQLEDGEMVEFNTSNNVRSVHLESLLDEGNGKTTITAALNNSDDGSTVTVSLQNNSMSESQTGNVIVTLLDEDGQVLEQKQTYTGDPENNGFLSLQPEEFVTLPAFNFAHQGTSVQVLYVDQVLDDDSANLAALTFSNLPGIRLDSFVQNKDGIFRASVSVYEISSTIVTAATQSVQARVALDKTPDENASNILSQSISLTPGEKQVITLYVSNGENAEVYELTINNLLYPVETPEPTAAPNPSASPNPTVSPNPSASPDSTPAPSGSDTTDSSDEPEYTPLPAATIPPAGQTGNTSSAKHPQTTVKPTASPSAETEVPAGQETAQPSSAPQTDPAETETPAPETVAGHFLLWILVPVLCLAALLVVWLLWNKKRKHH